MDVMEEAIPMSGGILDGFQTIIPTAAAVLSEKTTNVKDDATRGC